jgi:hypothetical protein
VHPCSLHACKLNECCGVNGDCKQAQTTHLGCGQFFGCVNVAIYGWLGGQMRLKRPSTVNRFHHWQVSIKCPPLKCHEDFESGSSLLKYGVPSLGWDSHIHQHVSAFSGVAHCMLCATLSLYQIVPVSAQRWQFSQTPTHPT